MRTITLNIDGITIAPKRPPKLDESNIGVTLDSHLSPNDRTYKSTCKSAYLVLRNIGRVRKY